MMFSALYSGVAMNNSVVLGTFLFRIGVVRLRWEFGAESCGVLLCAMIVGCLGGFNVTYPLWWGLAVLVLFPASFALVALLGNKAVANTVAPMVIFFVLAAGTIAILTFLVVRQISSA